MRSVGLQVLLLVVIAVFANALRPLPAARKVQTSLASSGGYGGYGQARSYGQGPYGAPRGRTGFGGRKKGADGVAPAQYYGGAGKPAEPYDYFNRPGPWDEANLDSLFTANRAWANRIKLENPMLFEDFKKGHAPKILYIGCSDARVPANEMFNQPPGSIFVHRNIANCVVNGDFNAMSVIQYAVAVLKVKHIIVCGHYDCGGIKASLTAADHKAPLENWLRNIRDTVRLHRDELLAIDEITDRQRRLVELNVQEQCLNIFKTGAVQARRKETSMMRSGGE
jgi:carbonic anhydrase